LNGFLAVDDLIPLSDIQTAREAVERYVEQSRQVTSNDSVFDLEPGHRADAPRLRRLKDPCRLDPIFRKIGWSDAVLDVVVDLIGPGIRYQSSKLNMKAAAFGSPVQWHQDFAFYPHTNDDLLAVGIALDDCTLENGCLLMIPGSHRGPIYEHHQNGVFVGAVDSADVRRAGAEITPVPVRAGGITLHHSRTLHASAPNRSPHPRRLLLIELVALDAWPVLGVENLEAFDGRILRGSPTRAFRATELDFRVPLPKPERQGSIYEIQEAFRQAASPG
jgi:hypothetical protein